MEIKREISLRHCLSPKSEMILLA